MNATNKITVAKARLPATYVEAKQALAKCARIDECADWADKAMALASYGKQAGDKALENLAQKILDRAIQRGGALLLELEKGKPGPKAVDELNEGPRNNLPTRKEAAKAANLTPHQAREMMEVASVPADQFDSLVECDKPATVTTLAEIGTKKRPKEPPDPLVDPHLKWRWAIKALVEAPPCGLDAMAAFMPHTNKDNLDECRLALSNLEAWRDALEWELAK